MWNAARTRKSDSVTDFAWERTGSQDGLQETTGMQAFVSRKRQVPGQLSWPLRDGCRKNCSREGVVEAERRESKQVDKAIIVLCRYDLIPKPSSDSKYFIRDDHFYFRGIGIYVWEYGFFLWGFFLWVFWWFHAWNIVWVFWCGGD